MSATFDNRAGAVRPPALRFLLGVLPLIVLLSSPRAGAQAPALQAEAFPPGEAVVETVLRVPQTGRYSLGAAGRAGGLRLELVDRMAGVIGGAEGTAGARLDAFLEEGEYKVRVGRPPAEPVGLTVRAFSAVGTGRDRFDVPELADGQSFAGELGDLELRSWWVRVDPADPVLLLEAQGRCLADAVLWRDGFWETGLRPAARTLEPRKGRPVTLLEFNQPLEPGWYLLTCVGGPPRPWAGEGEERPFHLSRGGRYLGEMGLLRLAIPESGTASFRVSGRATWIQMEAVSGSERRVPAGGPATGGVGGGGPAGPDGGPPYRLAVAPDRQGGSRHDAAETAGLDGRSGSRRCALRLSGTSGRRWVTLQGPAGAAVEVRWFAATRGPGREALLSLDLARSPAHLLLTLLGAAEGGESLDLTGLVTAAWREGRANKTELWGWEDVPLGADRPLRRRFNGLAPCSVLVAVERRGRYALFEGTAPAAGGPPAAGRYLLQPVDDALAKEGAPPLELRPGEGVDLPARLYLLTVVPESFGILDFALVAAEEGREAAAAEEAERLFASPPPQPGNGSGWTLQSGDGRAGTIRLLLASRGPVTAGLQNRALPLDPEEPACLRLGPGEEFEIPFTARREVRLFVETRSPSPGLQVGADGEPWREERTFAEGGHSLTLFNRSGREAWLIVGARAAGDARLVGRERPRRPDPAALLPSFGEGRPLWRDFERGESAAFLLSVTEPASYRLSTSGRLAMGLTVRTPLRPRLFEAAQNADGRNAALTAYLRPGLYLLQAAAQGASRGRAGVALERLDLLPAGTLAEGVTLRRTVPAGVLLSAEVRIGREGDYRLECTGLRRAFPWRLEDAGGWPVGAPVGSGPAEARLAPGAYRYLSAAEPVATRRLLSLRAVEAAGADPAARTARRLPIALGRAYPRIWVEEEGRPEDVFPFTLPAALRLSLALSEGMRFRVVDAAGAVAAGGLGGEPAGLELPAGAYELRVRRVEEDNLAPYELALDSESLFAGSERAVACPGEVPVAVGGEGTVELWSRGGTEVEAVLTDGQGRVVARGEPIPDDWNFRLVADLPPGRYRLQLSPPGAGGGGAAVAAGEGGPAGRTPAGRSIPRRSIPGRSTKRSRRRLPERSTPGRNTGRAAGKGPEGITREGGTGRRRGRRSW